MNTANDTKSGNVDRKADASVDLASLAKVVQCFYSLDFIFMAFKGRCPL